MYNLHIYEREDLTPIRKLLMMKAIAGGVPLSDYTVTGNPVSFNTNVAKPLSVVAAFTPVQAGSGDPSPENVRPITGWNGAKFTRSGKNLLDPKLFETSNNSYVKYETGALQNWSAAYRASDYVPIIAGFQYTLHAAMWGQNSAGTAFYDSEKQYISGFKMNNKTQTDYTFTAPEGAAYMRFCATDDIIGFDGVFLVFGDEAGTFEEYVTPQSVSVTFPAEAGTVYGGTLDLSTGVLTVMYAGKVVRETNTFYASGNYIKSDAFDAFIYITNPYSGLGICNVLKRSNGGIWCDVGYPNTFRINGTQLHINIANDLLGITDYTQETTTTATQKMKAYLEELYENGTPLMVVYPMSPPIEYQLSGTEILSLIGNNVLWSDLNGDLNVTYKKKG